ncbi:putative antibiotic biosynthesis monooxygenase [Kalymmatonema gypsitolerans NIES-4073]|nr:putative antibiotic biosynthesis monooxygenase [Scytonema sp. NIES-4073]
MIAIKKGQPLVTLITVHTCKPEVQQQLVELLAEALNTIYRHVPGFVSASIHKSLDGVRVTNYAQWQSREAFESVKDNPAILPFAQRVAEIASFDPHLYEVTEVYHA